MKIEGIYKEKNWYLIIKVLQGELKDVLMGDYYDHNRGCGKLKNLKLDLKDNIYKTTIDLLKELLYWAKKMK